MPSSSDAQERFINMLAHNDAIRREVGMSKASVKEWHAADKRRGLYGKRKKRRKASHA